MEAPCKKIILQLCESTIKQIASVLKKIEFFFEIKTHIFYFYSETYKTIALYIFIGLD